MKGAIAIVAASLLLLAGPVQAGSSSSTSHGMSGSSTVPNTGPGSASFNRYLQSHSGLSQLASPHTVPNTGPGSSSFNSYLQSHQGLSQYSSPMPTQPTAPLN
ncbi:MAG: hypothetical protein JO255_04370 [Alphaproteobacteria bacterium]|nr:hypothetical protein [Alphaproteobacteria bacterium]